MVSTKNQYLGMSARWWNRKWQVPLFSAKSSMATCTDQNVFWKTPILVNMLNTPAWSVKLNENHLGSVRMVSCRPCNSPLFPKLAQYQTERMSLCPWFLQGENRAAGSHPASLPLWGACQEAHSRLSSWRALGAHSMARLPGSGGNKEKRWRS